jgi:hypothetical protein
MLRNRKGVAIIDDIIVIAVIGAVCYFVAPTVSRSVSQIFGGADKVHKTLHTKVTQEPVKLGVDIKGKDIIGYKTLDEKSTEALSMDYQPTLWDKIKQVFWVLIGVAIFCIIFPASVVAKIKNMAMQRLSEKLDGLQAKHDTLKTETTKIVNGVKTARASMDETTKAKMSTILKDTYNDSTKALVTDIKTNGTITTL